MTGLVTKILVVLSSFVIAVISAGDYFGIAVLMAIESACIPLPSEVIMPFSGYLVSTGRFTLIGVSLAGAFGCVAGSVVAYYIGMYGGRPLAEKYGKYLLMRKKDLDLADRWFEKYGEIIILASRMLPIIRTFIAFPAGVARMNFAKFCIYTFIGSFPWCLGLAYIGKKMGDHWVDLKKYFHGADWVIGIIIVAAIAYFIFSHIKKNGRTKN
jgi:membrane protein DedA with SNARE-associated domain